MGAWQCGGAAPQSLTILGACQGGRLTSCAKDARAPLVAQVVPAVAAMRTPAALPPAAHTAALATRRQAPEAVLAQEAVR